MLLKPGRRSIVGIPQAVVAAGWSVDLFSVQLVSLSAVLLGWLSPDWFAITSCELAVCAQAFAIVALSEP